MSDNKSDKSIDKMNDLCPNCGQLTNSSFSRLVKDACGHMKCRMCLLYEEQGCESCQKERTACNTNDFKFSMSSNQSMNKSTISDANSSTVNNTIVLPLKLVIDKNLEQYSSLSQERKDISEDCSKTSSIINDNQNNVTKLDQIEINQSELDKTKSLEDNTNLSENKERENKSKKINTRSHIIIIPGDPEKYQCVVCQKIFKNKKCFHYHNVCATGIKPFQCTICDKSFINRSHFEYHERTHTGYKPFKCHLCDKAFPQRNKLNRHMTSHNNEKNFACSKCDKKYSKKSDLQNHLYIHSSTTSNKFSCKSCGKAFGNITHLKRHSRAHSNERPHVCEHCNKSFKDKSLLIRHYKTHGKERPFTCAHCSRGFLTKSELRRHLTVHSDEKPFSCHFCQTVFRRKDNLNRHIRHHHSEDERSIMTQSKKVKSSDKFDFGKSTEKNQEKVEKSKTKKVKKSFSKSQHKVSKLSYTNSQKQINSRLDPMGNITPVIRTTGQVSNAVPVINGPTITRRNTESSDVPKKTLMYMEPIPPEEAVVINKRIEAKLYPQSNISQNFFNEFSDSNDNLYLNSNSLLRASLSFNNRGTKSSKQSNSNCDAFNSNDTFLENPSASVPDKYKCLSYKTERGNVICYDEKIRNNYVSTIKKNTLQKDF